MKKLLFINLFILAILISGIEGVIAQKVEKNYQKNFTADPSTIIDIDSKFGEVKILEWEENSVEVKANIWVESNKEETARELLSKLDAEISKSENRITVESILPSKLNTGKKTNFRIDFEIHAPANVDLELSSKYGAVYVEELSGHADISVKYGTIRIQELSRGKEKPLNHINLAYSSGSIEEAGWLKLDMAYSKIAIDEAQALMVLSKYSGLTIDECSSLVLDSKYDNYSLGELNNFLGDMKYGNLKIDELRSQLEIKSAYTSVKVDEISSEFETLKIDNSRGGYKISLSDNAAFTINGYANRGDISVTGMGNLNKRTENADTYVDGKYGDNPSSKIDIEVKDGSVKITLE